ncbi:MAG: CHAP domain-containing protein [Clostridiales bacterium]|nr:CHAP domain-containing protein [Clostridiales bacterium]
MIRTTRPTAGNKYFITKSNGGYSTCIQGKPTDGQCNVLANCVGYACGGFNEELDLGYEKYHLNCNAENFIERAIASGLSVINKPCVGAILCWEGKGSLAGHVAIVIEVINDNCIRTAESGYGCSTPFWTTTRYNNNGRWGMNSNYTPRGFIVNPNYPYNPAPTPQPTPTPTKYKVGDVVNINGVYVSSDSTEKLNPIITRGTITNILEGAKNPYLLDNGNIGWVNDSCIIGDTPAPTPQPTTDLLDLVRKTIRGDFGNGQDRVNALGDNYNEVQRQVNLNYQHGTTNWDNIRIY